MSIDPPRPRFPPLNALRAFEAAARLGGFTRAAEELCVTPGAIAQHIKTLEAWFAAPLFARSPRGVDLTPEAARALDDLSAAFDALGSAQRHLMAELGVARVHIAALPAIAQLWLAPRLPVFRAALPGLELSVTALEEPPNLAREPFDMALFFGEKGEALVQDFCFPVCAPGLARDLTTPDDLARAPCISDSSWAGDWQDWLAACGARVAVSGPSLSLYALAVEETLTGGGVLMGHDALIARYLESGELVRPFTASVPRPSLRLTLPEGKQTKAARQIANLLRAGM